MDHCEKWRRKRSFHDSCRRSSWSLGESVWKGARHLTHRTAMNSSRAVVSWNTKSKLTQPGQLDIYNNRDSPVRCPSSERRPAS